MSLYGIKDSANLTLFSKKTGKPVLYADYCNQTSLNMTADTVYAMKKTARAISWDTAKEGTLTMEMQVFDLRWIALLMGSLDLDDPATAPQTLDWARREVLTITTAGSATLKDAPKANSLTLYKLMPDGITLGAEVEATANDKALTIADAKVGDKYCAFYLTPVENSRKFTVYGDKYPQGYRVVFDTQIRDTDQQDHFVQFEFFNLRPKAQIELTMSAEDVCTLSVEWDVLVNNENKFYDFLYLDGEYAGEEGSVTDGYTKVAAEDLTGKNPSEQGWYELVDGEYVLTEDTTVTADKDYYTKNQG